MSRKPDWAKIAFDFHRHRDSLKESLPGLDVYFTLSDYGYGARYSVSISCESPKLSVTEQHEDLNKAVSAAMKKLRTIVAEKPVPARRAVVVNPSLAQKQFPELVSGGVS